MRKLLLLVVLVVLFAGVLYVAAGQMPGPEIRIVSPERFAGTSTAIVVEIVAPAGVSDVQVAFEQNDARTLLVGSGDPLSEPDAEGVVRLNATLDRETVPDLRSGEGRLVVTVSEPVLRGLRTVSREVTRDLVVRLEPPRLAVLSTFHYINQGGSEMVLYRVSPTPEEAGLAIESGVDVGGLEYPGFPASGVSLEGVAPNDPGLRVAFFALLHDQPADTPIQLYARDEAGNAASLTFEHRVFPKSFRSSRIGLDDAFLARVVPPILDSTDEVSPEGPLIDQYVVVNSDLRQANAATIAQFASDTAPEMLWQGDVFYPFTNNSVESGFADRRTYVYEGREVDRQVHLGFDLASVSQAPVPAANRGRVLFAETLGIYGQTVIIDHGMGLQSLYAHLSSIAVEPGAMVEKGDSIGRTGTTGLAGGDHLHFTMLVNGRMVNPVEWWDAHWIQDRILRKLGRGESR